ncbi:MAG: hypothetical protein ACRD0P_09000, partial [Stackebrandtia sp.]
MNGISLPLRLLMDFARTHRDDSDSSEAVSRYLLGTAVPDADWGELPFSNELATRWTQAIDARVGELARLRERQVGMPQWLPQTAEGFAGADDDVVRVLRELAEGHSGTGEPGNVTETYGAVGVTLPSESGPGTAELVGLPEVPVHRESPGSEELMSCLAEHLSTLERAEGLLRGSGRLDFTAPTDYLRQLATVR